MPFAYIGPFQTTSEALSPLSHCGQFSFAYATEKRQRERERKRDRKKEREGRRERERKERERKRERGGEIERPSGECAVF